MKCSVIGIDLAKNIFQICALDQNRKVVSNKKIKRSNLLSELRQYEPTLVVMEACYSSNPFILVKVVDAFSSWDIKSRLFQRLR